QFERAAQIRDQRAALQRIQAQQIVTAEGQPDVDVFAIVGEAGEYAVSVMLVRGGRNLGTTSYFPRAALAEADEALASFILQYYADAEAPAQVHDERGERLVRSEEHTSELQSLAYLVCRLLLEKKKNLDTRISPPTHFHPLSYFLTPSDAGRLTYVPSPNYFFTVARAHFRPLSYRVETHLATSF